MKKTVILICTILMAGVLLAQSPQAFKYQAVVRDIAGNILSNQLISIRASVIQGTTTGTSVYSETHQTTTNEFGLATLEIGTGSVVSGSFASIDWSAGPYFLKIELDVSGGTTFELMGTSQLLSVPYALHAGTTSNPDDGDWTISGDDLYSATTGNVGIGTSLPGAKLDVAGSIWQTEIGNSVFLGENAGLSDDKTENENVFVGYNAGRDNTSGILNVAIGNEALANNISGNYNTALGSSSLNNNETGTQNVAVGIGALSWDNNSDKNTVLGNGAMGYKSGNNNTVLGFQAGYAGADDINGCVFLGYKAGYNESGDNKLYIENSDSDSPLIYGEFNSDILGINGKLGIGTMTPSTTLEVAGHIAVSNTGNSVFIGQDAGLNDDLTDNFNVFIGNQSGILNTTGDNNTGAGHNSLSSNSIGYGNTAIGFEAMVDNTEGQYNSAIGLHALRKNTTGNHNTAIGRRALEDNDTDSYNTAIGEGAMAGNDFGGDNVAVGYGTFFNGFGHQNTIIGSRAGAGAISANGCVLIGYKAGSNIDDNDRLYIENSSSDTPLIYGHFGADILAVNGSLGVGTMSPSATLDVAGHIAVSNTGNSVFIGQDAGLNDDLTDNYNVFIGSMTGATNTAGISNSAIGEYAMNMNSSGNYNTALGSYALSSNTVGNWNTAIGRNALKSNTIGGGNVAIGGGAITGNQTGSNNTIIGASAGSGATDLDGCVFIGHGAGSEEYSDNTLHIGNSYNPLIYGEFDNDILSINGNLGVTTENPEVKLHVTGGTDVSLAGGGSILAGLTTGENIALDENEIMARNNGAISSLHLQRNGGALMVHYELAEINEFIINTAGRTGIGETTPTAKLHINTSPGEDGVRVQVDGATNFKVHSNGGIANYNVTTPTFALQLENSSLDLQGRGKAWSWNLWSDSRVKSKQRTIEYGLNEVMKLEPKSYDHHSSSTSEEGEFIMVTDHKTPSIGFIAQEVQKIIPEAVSEPEDEANDLWSMDYNKLIPVLTRAIQEQQLMIDKLNSENEAFKKRLNILENQ